MSAYTSKLAISCIIFTRNKSIMYSHCQKQSWIKFSLRQILAFRRTMWWGHLVATTRKWKWGSCGPKNGIHLSKCNNKTFSKIACYPLVGLSFSSSLTALIVYLIYVKVTTTRLILHHISSNIFIHIYHRISIRILYNFTLLYDI